MSDELHKEATMPTDYGFATGPNLDDPDAPRYVALSKTEPIQLPQQVPEELRYIMWRYFNDHSGEDHRERYRLAAAWLASVTMSVRTPSPTVELTPVRIQALKDLLEAADHWSIGATRIARVIVEEMLAETTPPKSA